MDRLFLYGTLLPDLAPPALADALARLALVGPATTPGRLLDLREYPALVPDIECASRVAGELHAGADAALLRLLDDYEDARPEAPEEGLFVRVRVAVRLADGTRDSAWAYAWNGPIDGHPLVPGSDWRAHRARRAVATL